MAVHYPTKELKEASESKPIISFIPDEDGRDPDPAWDHVARSVWPTTIEGITSRDTLAEVLMYASNDEVLNDAAPQAVIVMSRMCQRLKGSEWMDKWLWDNQLKLKKKVDYNRKNYGAGFFSRLWRKMW